MTGVGEGVRWRRITRGCGGDGAFGAAPGYTRVHNAVSGKKDLVRLPGLVAVAYQHETSRAGTRICTPMCCCRTNSRA